ncbi:b-glycosyltransferase-related protein, glycosyltransferase family 2 protein [unidentified eubacterium SCB49]|nr:b-glycosyltransferase-related protein, glycosyltransferase family 2 protein [unidentified eubacterium SCB49]
MIYIFISIIYTLLIGYFILGIHRLFKTSEILSIEDASKSFTKFSIVIPFRNEAERLPGLLDSLSQLKYPKEHVEVLCINDESTDSSVQIIEAFMLKNPSFHVRILNNKRVSSAPKKDAITMAISEAKNEWIITTDADCLIPSQWLNCYHKYITSNPVAFIAGPVIYKSSNTFIDQFQLLDNLSLQGVTMGSFGHKKGLFCNGANLAYTKSLFKEINGFANNNHIASGDDVFMLENVQAIFPEKVGYLANKDAVITTFTEKTWKNLIAQRVRWAKKTGKQNALFTKTVGFFVLAANLTLILCLLSLLLFNTAPWVFVVTLVLKLGIDAILLQKTGRFFGKHISVVRVISFTHVYAFISCWVVFKSFFTNYTWKGRKHQY